MRADARRNRDAILTAARELFADQGLDVQVEEIARRAKLGVGTLYRHFPTKEDLLDALIARRFELLTSQARDGVGRASRGEAWAAFRDYMIWASELQAGDRALCEAMATRSEHMHAAASDSGLIPELELLLDYATRAGALRDDLLVEDILAMVRSVGPAATAQKLGWRWDSVLAIWLDGVRTPGFTEPPPRLG